MKAPSRCADPLRSPGSLQHPDAFDKAMQQHDASISERVEKPSRLAMRLRWPALTLAALAALMFALAPLLRGCATGLTEEQVRTTVLTTLETEVPERFLVTGAIEMGTTTTSERKTKLLPGFLDLEVGRTTVTVRVPGRASYGVNLRDLQPEDIHYVSPERVVEVDVPPLSVYSSEVRTDEIEIGVENSKWQRLSREPERSTVQAAVRQAQPAIRAQAESYVASSDQPRLNTARALAAMLRTPLAAAGEEGIRFRFIMAPGDTLEVGPEGERRVVPIQ